MTTVDKQTKQIEKYEKLLAEEKESHTKTKIKLKAKELELHAITQSNSYKLARILAISKHGLRVVKVGLHNLTPRRIKLIKGNQQRVKRVYNSEKFNKEFLKKPSSNLAVVIHLYYSDLLPYFEKKLELLNSLKYDLFITVVEKDRDLVEVIKKKHPGACVVVVPNCGRDVLPFVEIVRKLDFLGYEKVLKLHSKKSPHRLDGDKWRDEIVGRLIPNEPRHLKSILNILDYKNTAIIGPENQYVSFLVNFTSTQHYSKKITSKVIDVDTAKNLFITSDEYGFFAGTMFWARIDALRPIIKTIRAEDFEPEFGQEDSTLAHALERLFSVIPELQKKDIYESTPEGVVKINYHTTNIPSWSEIALED